MNVDLKNSLMELITRISALEAELESLSGWKSSSHLGFPASADQVDTIERLAGFKLPPDYRIFLELHNGWHGFSGEYDILPAEQMTQNEIVKSIEELKAMQRELGDPSDGFVIMAAVGGSDLVYFDPASRRSDGTIDVVYWDPCKREGRRHPSFLAFLEREAVVLEQIVAKERKKVR